MKNAFTLFIGFMLILIGLSILLDILHVFNFASYLLKLWPVLIIIWGLSELTKGKFYWGVILIALGLLFIISNFGLITFSVFAAFWPMLIILLGLNVIVQAFRHDKVSKKSSNGDTVEVVEKGKSINEVNVLGDKKIQIGESTTDGGSAVTILGSTRLDFTETKVGKNGAILEIVTVLGETSILVPDTMNVKLDSVPVLGEIHDQRKSTSKKKTDGTLLIKGVAVLGSINIK